MKNALIISETIREINRTADKRKSDLNLVALDSYFEGTGYRSDRADHFALAAPPVTFSAPDAALIYRHVVHYRKRAAGTDLRAQATTVAFFYIYYRYHLCFHPLYSN